MKKNNDKNKTYLKKSIVGLTLVSAVSLLPLTFDKTSSKEQAESSSVDLKSNFQTNTPLANEQVSKVQTYQKFGHDQGVSSSILAVTDPWETIVDITRYEKDNKKHLIAKLGQKNKKHFLKYTLNRSVYETTKTRTMKEMIFIIWRILWWKN
ncbi:hypothetical protein [Mycoplasmopsis pulmonis]|uniref:hypothetical protein n=1 Tax=Mycoplasmopsis pulmonis TaxID=2107 RepID=UPI00101D0FF3|nr:hypothetical protein [Mycoplasmopsis pulmonis]